jgi:hypothetical protein
MVSFDTRPLYLTRGFPHNFCEGVSPPSSPHHHRWAIIIIIVASGMEVAQWAIQFIGSAVLWLRQFLELVLLTTCSASID